MYKLMKNLPIQRVLIFRIQGGGFDNEGGEIQGLRPPSGLCILPILNFLTDFKIKYNET